MRSVLALSLCVILLLTVTASAQDCSEGERRECGSDIGICKPGRSICKDGEWVECVGSEGPISETEVCGNGLDDNCDGEVDEGCFPWMSFILVGLGILFIGIGLHYMHKERGERIITKGLADD